MTKALTDLALFGLWFFMGAKFGIFLMRTECIKRGLGNYDSSGWYWSDSNNPCDRAGRSEGR